MSHFDGHPPIPGRRIAACVKRAHGYGLVVTSTTDGQHAPGSYHGQKRAIDVGFSAKDLQRLPPEIRRAKLVSFQRREFNNFKRSPDSYREIIGPDNNMIVLRGAHCPLAEGTRLEQQHDDHVHVSR